MSSIGLALVLATSLNVALPAFEVKQLSNTAAKQLPDAYAAALEDRHCASPTSAGQLGKQATASFAKCGKDAACLSDVARVLGVQFVILGRAQKIDAFHLIELSILDVQAQRVTNRIEHRHQGKLSEIDASVRQQIDSLCKAINPAWTDTSAAEHGLAALSFEAPTPSAPAKPSSPAPVNATPEVTEEKQAPQTRENPPALALVAPEEKQPSSTLLAAPVSATPRKFPWAIVTGSAAIVSAGVGVGLGAYSRSLWSADHPVTVNGVTQHSLSHVEGERANSFAHAANAMFIAAGVLAVGTGVIAYVQGGFGFSGHF